MTLRQIKNRLWKYKPTNETDLLVDCDLTLSHLGQGAFRNTYRVVGTPYVIKVPMGTETQGPLASNIEHSRQEHSAYYHLRYDKRFASIQTFLLEIHFCSHSTGMMLMDYYADHNLRYNSLVLKTIENQVYNLLGESCDLHSSNFGIRKDGSLVFIDLGCFIIPGVTG